MQYQLPLRAVWEISRGDALLCVAAEAHRPVWLVDVRACRTTLEQATDAWREAFPLDPFGAFLSTYVHSFVEGALVEPVLDERHHDRWVGSISLGGEASEKDEARRLAWRRVERRAMRAAQLMPGTEPALVDLTRAEVLAATLAGRLRWAPTEVGFGAFATTEHGSTWLELVAWSVFDEADSLVMWATRSGDAGFLEIDGGALIAEASRQQGWLRSLVRPPLPAKRVVAALLPTWSVDGPEDPVAWWAARRADLDLGALDHPSPRSIARSREHCDEECPAGRVFECRCGYSTCARHARRFETPACPLDAGAPTRLVRCPTCGPRCLGCARLDVPSDWFHAPSRCCTRCGAALAREPFAVPEPKSQIHDHPFRTPPPRSPAEAKIDVERVEREVPAPAPPPSPTPEPEAPRPPEPKAPQPPEPTATRAREPRAVRPPFRLGSADPTLEQRIAAAQAGQTVELESDAPNTLIVTLILRRAIEIVATDAPRAKRITCSSAVGIVVDCDGEVVLRGIELAGTVIVRRGRLRIVGGLVCATPAARSGPALVIAEGTGEVTLDGTELHYLRGQGDGLHVRDDARARLTRASVSAPGSGVVASGRAHVEIDGGAGTECGGWFVEARDDATVRLSNAWVDKAAGVCFARDRARVTAHDLHARESRFDAFRVEDDAQLELRDVYIDAAGHAAVAALDRATARLLRVSASSAPVVLLAEPEATFEATDSKGEDGPAAPLRGEHPWGPSRGWPRLLQCDTRSGGRSSIRIPGASARVGSRNGFAIDGATLYPRETFQGKPEHRRIEFMDVVMPRDADRAVRDAQWAMGDASHETLERFTPLLSLLDGDPLLFVPMEVRLYERAPRDERPNFVPDHGRTRRKRPGFPSETGAIPRHWSAQRAVPDDEWAAEHVSLFPTRDPADLDAAYVAEMAERIRRGGRPLIVATGFATLSASIYGEAWLVLFVLDGHHALAAYERAGVRARVLSLVEEELAEGPTRTDAFALSWRTSFT